MTSALLGFAAFFTLALLLRLPIGFILGLTGFVGIGLLRGWNGAVYSGATEIFEATGYMLSVVPLFVLMGNLVSQGGLSRDIYQAAYAFLGHRRGGLVTSTIVASAGFGAVCGSSTATVATIARIAMPEMQRLGYSQPLAAASVAAGGTLGILIPPSAVMVLYGIITETSIGALFAAGLLPGLLASAAYVAAGAWTVWRDPAAGPRGMRTGWIERLRALRDVWAVLALFLLVIGGMYGGLFTAVEAAGVGAVGGLVIALARRQLSLRILKDVLVDSAVTTAMVFSIIIGAMLFANFVNLTGMPAELGQWIRSLDLSATLVLLVICGIYVALGCVMESISMVLLTIPVFFPVVVGLGVDPVWFGILIVCVVEIGLITPPVGMNVFVIRAFASSVPIGRIWRAMVPFVVADIVRLAVLIAAPSFVLLLPRLLGLH
jgi:C4-dicarboxylate transporter, DctM subunit